MAEVTGDIGGQPVQLNNAATEATLRQLLAAMTAMAKAQGVDLKAQKDLEKELKKLAKETEKQAKAAKAKAEIDQKAASAEQKRLKQAEDAKKAHDKYIKSLEETEKALGDVANVIKDASGAITDLTKSVASMGNSATAAAAMFGKLPVVGGLVANVFGGIAEAGEKTYKAFQQASTVGANFGGSINEMIKSSSAAGMTIEGFTNIVAKNGQNLALLGGSTAEGAKRLAQFGKQIRENTQLNSELATLGYSTEDVNNGLARYSAMMLKSGRSQADVNKNLVAETGEYLKNLDAVSKLTGKNKEALQEEADARRNDAQFRIAERKLDPQSRKNLEMLMQSMSKAEQEAFKGALATGTMNEAMVKLNATSPQVAQEMMKTALAAKSSGQLTKDSALQLDRNMTAAAKAAQNNGTLNVLGANLAADYNDQVISTLDRAARTSSLEEQIAKNAAEKERAQKTGMTPEQMKTFQENLAQLSNRFSQLLADNMPKFITAFESISRLLEGPLVSGFTLLIDNLGKVVVGLVALKVAQLAYQNKLRVEQAKANQRGSSSKDPMFVRDADGKGLGGGTDKAGGKTAKGSSIGKIAKIGGVVGAVAAVTDLVSDLSDISSKEKSGEMSADEAKEAKGGAIGGAAGGAGGAWAGAAAGAAIGSVIPVIGTAVGGLLGGTIGYFVGNKAGEAAGKAIAKPTEKLEKTTKAATEATRANTEATQSQTAEQKKAAEAAAKKPEGPNWADPVSTLKYFRETMKQPGTGATPAGPAAAPSTAGTSAQPVKNFDALQKQLASQGITDPKAVANIMAQVQAESGGVSKSENLNYSGQKLFELYGAGNKGGNKVRFKTMEEANAVAAKGPEAVGNVIYGGRMGNAENEGFKYRGRGLIQLTGKDNYAKFGKMIGVDLVNNPDLANDPNIAQQIAAAYFGDKQKKGVDLSSIEAIGKAVGYAGGAAETAKRAQLAQGFQAQMAGGGSATAVAGANTPSTPAAQTVQTALAKPPEAAAPATATPAIPQRPTMGAAQPAQDPAVTLLASLNTKMDMLIAVSQKTSQTAEKQVRVSSAMSADMMISA